MPEPQLHPYEIKKRSGNVGTSHGCKKRFNKEDDNLYVLVREEQDWWPKTNKEECIKQWSLNTRNRYYCVKLSCILSRRPFISKYNLTVTYIGDQVGIVEQLVEAM